MTVDEYETRFEFILKTEMEKPVKDAMLSSLMKDMEWFFQIPEIITEKWETENPKACVLHRRIANSRIMVFEE
jgi:hypothetical protein